MIREIALKALSSERFWKRYWPLCVLGICLVLVVGNGYLIGEENRPLTISENASNKAVQANILNAMLNAEAYYQQAGTFRGLTPAGLERMEPGLRFSSGPPGSTPDDVGFNIAGSGKAVEFGSWSRTGVCWYAVQSEAEGAGNGLGLPKDAPAGMWYGWTKHRSPSACGGGATDSPPATGPGAWSQQSKMGWLPPSVRGTGSVR